MSYRTEVLDDSPVAYWRLGDFTQSATVLDETGNYNGTRFGPIQCIVPGLAGTGSALGFDGADDYCSLTTLGTFGQSLNSCTIEFLLDTTEADQGRVILGTLNDNTTTGLQIFTNYSSSLVGQAGSTTVWVRDDNGSLVTAHIANSAVYDGSWHHHAIRIDGTTVTWAVDGSWQTVSYGQQQTLSALSSFQYPLTIGGRNNRGTIDLFFGGGDLDDVAVYDLVLSDSRIASHYSAVSTAAGNVAYAGFESSDEQLSPRANIANRQTTTVTAYQGTRSYSWQSSSTSSCDLYLNGTSWWAYQWPVVESTQYTIRFAIRATAIRNIELYVAYFNASGSTVQGDTLILDQNITAADTWEVWSVQTTPSATGAFLRPFIRVQTPSLSDTFYIDAIALNVGTDDSYPTYTPSGPMQYLRPDSDVVITGWTDQAGGTTNLYATIDEISASDADYIKVTP